jgi:hypothetical protein
MLIENGYIYVYHDLYNRYYVREDLPDVIELFSEMDNLNRYYEIISLKDTTKWLRYE